MEFRISDTFTDSLARLTGDEQKAIKTTAFDLQISPANPGLQFHKLDKAKDKNFWSVRVNRDIRLIVHKTDASLLLCFVAHHDDAYRWAERRKLEVHPKTGAAQFVVIRESVVEVAVRKVVESVREKPRLFAHESDADLLSYGVPQEWISEVKQVNEDTLLDIASYLPAEASESLLQLATGGRPSACVASITQGSAISLESRVLEVADVEVARTIADSATRQAVAFSHPDAQRRFRLIENREELERALEYPWEKWTTFLHPSQRDVVEAKFSGPARVSGSAGTGKTIVALHRAVHLARTTPEARVLLATFSDTLAHALRTKLRRLVGNEPRLAERIDVYSIDVVGMRLHKTHIGTPKLADENAVAATIKVASDSVGSSRFRQRFLLQEWSEVVDAWQLDTWDAYRDVQRLGRKTRLSEPQRRVLWSIFERVRSDLAANGMLTTAGMFTALSSALRGRKNVPYDFAVIDESQDISVSQLRFLATLGEGRPNALFFAGDIGQRIFQAPFSWKSAGVDIRGRSRTLRVNYRTSHQIRTGTDRLLDSEVADVDGIREKRSDTVSVFNGPPPTITVLASESQEAAAVAEWLKNLVVDGLQPHEMAVFVRSAAEISRGERALEEAGVPFKVLDEHVKTASGFASLSTMHLAKGLEFRAVAVMACDDEIIPSQQRIQEVGDEADLQEVYDTERHLLYVACTRSRDYLLVSAVRPASEFLDDLSQ